MQFDTEQDLIETVATQYLEKQEQDLTEEYKALGNYNEKAFEEIPVNVEFTAEDPYKDAQELWDALDNDETLYIFNGGSSPEGMTETQNLKGRAVHDYFGHYKNRCDFTVEGEFTKWYNQREEVPDNAEKLLFSEVVGQVTLVHYLENGFDDEDFEQRSVLLDDEVLEATAQFYNQQL